MSVLYQGNQTALITMPNDELVVQPSKLAILRRQYACANSYAATARALIAVGSPPIKGTQGVDSYVTNTFSMNGIGSLSGFLINSYTKGSTTTAYSPTTTQTFTKTAGGWKTTSVATNATHNGAGTSGSFYQHWEFVPSSQYGWVLQYSAEWNNGVPYAKSIIDIPANAHTNAQYPWDVSWSPTLTFSVTTSGTGGTNTSDYPYMGLFRRPAERSDGAITYFTAEYYGVLDTLDYGQFYDTYSSEIHQYTWDTTTGKYVAPVLTRNFVIPAGDSVSIVMPTYAQLAADSITITDQALWAGGATTSAHYSTSLGVTEGTYALYTFDNYDNTTTPIFYTGATDPIDPSTIAVGLHAIEQTNYGVVQEVKARFGITTAYG